MLFVHRHAGADDRPRLQGGAAVPLDKATVSKEVAQRTLMKNQINASIARQIVDACVDFARNQTGGPGTTPSSSSHPTATSLTRT